MARAPFAVSVASALVLCASVAGVAGLPRVARADEGPHEKRKGEDTSYGRLEGDLSASAGVGAAFGPRGPRASIDLRLRYLWTAGLFFTYEDGPFWSSAAEPRRAFALGAEIRPFFLSRWANGFEIGNPWLDLFVDSIGLELGAVFVEPAGRPFGKNPGLQAGLGVQIPILPNATGPILGVHGGGRWSTASLAGDTVDAAGDRSAYLLVTLAWQQVFGAHIVDLGDRSPAAR